MAAPTMTRAPPRLPQPSSSDISVPPLLSPSPPSPPLPVPDAAGPKNPWRINSAAAAAAAPAAVTLIGEPPSSWPPLSSAQSHRRSSDSPPLPPPTEIHDGTLDRTPADHDPSSSSSSEIGSREEVSAPRTLPMTTTMEDTPAWSPPPSVQAPRLPRISPGNAAAADHVRSPRPPVSPQRRGGRGRWNQNHQRGVGGGGQRNHYGNHRPPAPGWRPNWNVNAAPLPPPPPPPPPPPLPQYPPWAFYPGSAVGVVPPAELNPYYVSYPQPYGEFVYADYNGYAAYYDHATYEMPYVPPLNPEISAGVPPSLVAPNVYVNQADTVKENVLHQIEYYFSEDNLVKDIYLRQQMDGDGWVDISKIASFRKIAALTEDTNLIRDALMPSNIVELQGNQMRRRHDWERWVLQQ